MYDEKINKLIKEMNKLPIGSIGKKIVNGHEYYYHRFYKDKKRVETYIDKNNVSILKEKINKRKELEKQLKELKSKSNNTINGQFHLNIKIKDDLHKYVLNVKNYKKRKCYYQIDEFIKNNKIEKVLILYGLRRTGKTTLMRQIILNMDSSFFNKTAFINVSPNDTLANLNKDLKRLDKLGYKYIFIDEVTFLNDFIEGASLLSDVYATSGMKIILSGTDSLGFILAKYEQLYDCCILIHTTYIPYSEFENVLNIKGIDNYILYGGTMSISGSNYNDYIFNDKEETKNYIDSAIAKNIQHSLKYYDNGNHFRHLQDLYEHNELTNVINRVVEDINHRFTKDVLIKEFKSNDLALSSKNLRKTNAVLDDIDVSKFTKRLKEMLEILDYNEQTIKLDDIHASEIKEYLAMLDLIYEVDVRSFPYINDIKKNIIVSQPGLRYCQATALIESLLLDKKFNELSLNEKNYISYRILNEIKGRMMEDIILLETKLNNKNKEVFKLQFAIGEFDMVVFDKSTSSCEIFEIKHSKECIKEQYKHLISKEKIDLTERKFGTITNKYVIYQGKTKDVFGIKYINAEEYLKEINN